MLSRHLTQADLASYIDTHFKAPRMVLAAAGGKPWILEALVINPLTCVSNVK